MLHEFVKEIGELAERIIATALNTVVGKTTVSSNLALSAEVLRVHVGRHKGLSWCL